MFAFEAHLDNQMGLMDEGAKLENVTESTITWAIDRLNGRNHTLLTLTGPDAHAFFVGGGNEGLYFVTYDRGGEEFGDLLADVESDIAVKLTVGGQGIRKKRGQCVSKDVAVKAAIHFATFGTRLPSGRWAVRTE